MVRVQQAIINQYKIIIILCLHLISLEEIIRYNNNQNTNISNNNTNDTFNFMNQPSNTNANNMNMNSNNNFNNLAKKLNNLSLNNITSSNTDNNTFDFFSQSQQQSQPQLRQFNFMNNQNNQNTFNMLQNQNQGIDKNNLMGGFNFNVTQTAPYTNNNHLNEDEFEEVKEENGNIVFQELEKHPRIN